MLHSVKPLRVAVIGAGVRGTSLARKLFSSEYRAVVTAVAEPDSEKRRSFVQEFKLPEEAAYHGWEDLTSKCDECDAVIIATLDNQHAEPALASLRRGWHILLEKPIADTFADCEKIVQTQKEMKKVVAVCHTLRFMDGFRKVKDLVESNKIGRLVHIDHMEAIGNIRFAHNYVRGRWARENDNTFLLLHKCSHDIDYLIWLFGDACLRVSSFGSLKYFKPEHAPERSALRCTNGCGIVDTCLYSALRMYVNSPLNGWPARDICTIHTRDEHLHAIETGPYGKCVWHADNDVVDHQVVVMEFEGGATATCTLTGYSATNGRRTRLQGTHGEMLFDEADGTITIKRFNGNDEEIFRTDQPISYHPEDQDIVDDWLSSVLFSTSVVVDATEALRTHAVVFAAEISRKERRTVEIFTRRPSLL
jgi:predicted dehydrogenase